MSDLFAGAKRITDRVFWLAGGIVSLVALGGLALALYHIRGSLSVWFIVILAGYGLLIALVVGLVRILIHRQRENDLIKGDLVDEMTANSAWGDLVESMRFIDDEAMKRLASEADSEGCLKQVVEAILAAGVNNILATYGWEEWRSVFLELQYDLDPQPTDKFIVVAERRHTAESLADIREHLSYGRGLAGTVLQDRRASLKYLPNIEAAEAREAGYIQTGSVSRHKSIVCSAVWVNDKPIGVLSIDCEHYGAFTDWDLWIIEQIYTNKIRLAYCVFRSSRMKVKRTSPSNSRSRRTAAGGRGTRRTGQDTS